MSTGGIYTLSQMNVPDDQLIKAAINILKHKGTDDNLSKFPYDQTTSKDPTIVERSKYLLFIMCNNFRKTRNKALDKYFDLQDQLLGMVMDGEDSEMGPVIAHVVTPLAPKGLVVAEIRNQIEKFMAEGRSILTEMFDYKKYKTGLDLVYLADREIFARRVTAGDKVEWVTVREEELWDQKEVPFLASVDLSPRRLYLETICKFYDSTRQSKESLDENGLHPYVQEYIKGEILAQREIDDKKISEQRKHPFLSKLEAINGNFDDNVVNFTKIYENHFGGNSEANASNISLSKAVLPYRPSLKIPVAKPSLSTVADDTMAYDPYVPDLLGSDLTLTNDFSYNFGIYLGRACEALKKKPQPTQPTPYDEPSGLPGDFKMTKREKEVLENMMSDKNLPIYDSKKPNKMDRSGGPRHEHGGLLRDQELTKLLNKNISVLTTRATEGNDHDSQSPKSKGTADQAKDREAKEKEPEALFPSKGSEQGKDPFGLAGFNPLGMPHPYKSPATDKPQ